MNLANNFELSLTQSGYKEVATKTLEPRPENVGHAHEYAVRGLVTAGEFIITSNGVGRGYKQGEEFNVPAGLVHTEAVGPDGTTITTGRMY